MHSESVKTCEWSCDEVYAPVSSLRKNLKIDKKVVDISIFLLYNLYTNLMKELYYENYL